MRRFIHALHDEEDGLALITAMMVTFVVFLLSVAVIQQAIHNVDASGYDQRRLRSVSAAEAGLHWAYNQLEFTEVFDLWEGTGADPLTLDVGSGDVDVNVIVTYYEDEAGFDLYDMTSPSAANPPRSLKITSTGVTAAGVERTMESFALLNPVYRGLNGAMISNNGLTITNNFNLSGNAGNDGDIVVESGNFSAPSGIENIRGSIYVPNGTALVGTNAHVYGSVWANGTVTVDHSQALIDGDVKSTAGSTLVPRGTVAGGAYYCTGSAPGATVQGTKVQTCSLGKPPTFGFPKIQFSAEAWEDEGYYIYNASGSNQCTNARDYIQGTTSGTFNGGAGVPAGYTGVVVRITASCTFDVSGGSITVGKNLAVVTSGAINLGNNSTWTGSGGTRDLFFMSPWNGSSAVCVGTGQDVTISNRNTFTNLEVSVYSVGRSTVANNNTFNGQIIGCNTTIQGNFTMNYRPVLIPGTDVVGFEQDVAYIREVS